MSNDEKPDAKFIRLQNGDDIIAEVVETEDEHGTTYTLYHPLKLVYVPSEQTGYVSIAFMPWVFPRIVEEQCFVLNDDDILLYETVNKKMNIYYWDSVDSYMRKSEELQVEQEQEEPELTDEEADELIDKLGLFRRTYH